MQDPLSQILDEVLAQVVIDVDLHARWLNTFSYLEYIGFRKIVKSQSRVTLETLHHASEECRHALLLKRLAIKIGGPSFASYETRRLLCAEKAEAYFQTLDSTCAHNLYHGTELTYLYVTWLVEHRALDVYRRYQLASPAVARQLTALLGEEERHLLTVASRLQILDTDFRRRSLKLMRIETRLYQDFLLALKAEIGAKGQALVRP